MKRIPPLVVCPLCQPGPYSYAGTIVPRVCRECKKALSDEEKGYSDRYVPEGR